ncbi:MAG: hypothetical protein VYD57_07935 [Pseudomonadota bacterium]|nr:hypothetical protein [Pseudomonadota bacterium]
MKIQSIGAVTGLIVVLSVPISAVAQTALTDEGGRYEMQPVEGGIARLDTQTGSVTLCRVRGDAIRCKPADAEGPREREGREARREFSRGLVRDSPQTRLGRIETRLQRIEDRLSRLEQRGRGQPLPLDEMKQVLRGFSDLMREFDQSDEPGGRGGDFTEQPRRDRGLKDHLGPAPDRL